MTVATTVKCKEDSFPLIRWWKLQGHKKTPELLDVIADPSLCVEPPVERRGRPRKEQANTPTFGPQPAEGVGEKRKAEEKDGGT